MTNILASLSANSVRGAYRKLGVDVDRFLVGVEQFDLTEDRHGLRSWRPAIPGDGKFYEQLSEHPWYYMKEKDEFEAARKVIGKVSVLEVGCGSGFFADGSEFASYTGLELNQAAAGDARAKGHHVEELMLHDYANEHPASADVVCSFQVLEHLTDPADYFLSALKILKPGGRLVTSVPAEDSFVGSIVDNVLNAPPHHLTRWTDEALKSFPLELGFDCLDVIHLPVENQHYKWFWNTLIERGMLPKGTSDFAMPKSLTTKLKVKAAIAALSALGFNFAVPKELSIPGHTVMAVHRKRTD
jgi:SAM-dependent methyltransferase